MKEVEYFFDCSSPWTYLSFEGILEVAKNREIEVIWKPILVGGIFNSINPSVYESRKNPIEEKMNYSQKDLQDWAKLRGITINWPRIFPINSVKAMRGAFYFIDKGGIESYLKSIFEAYWTDGSDISDLETLLKIIESNGADMSEYKDFIETPEVKERLIQNTQELMERGGFGSPTFFIDKTDMYFGNDRIQLMESIL